MKNKKVLQFLHSLVAVPLIATTMQVSGLPALSIVGPSENNSVMEVSVITTQEMEIRKENAEKINKYFESRDLPLAGYGEKFVEEAEKNDIDPFLLPAIAMRESTGGKKACKKVPNSVFGWGSCKISFKSIDESIEILAKNLGGNNPNTAHHYDEKTTEQILRRYNSYIKNYPKEVARIMNTMESIEVEKSIELASNIQIK